MWSARPYRLQISLGFSKLLAKLIAFFHHCLPILIVNWQTKEHSGRMITWIPIGDRDDVLLRVADMNLLRDASSLSSLPCSELANDMRTARPSR